jgi:hypothetical protein
MWMMVSLKKQATTENDLDLRDPNLLKVLKSLKFLIWFSKIEVLRTCIVRTPS